MKYLLKKDPDSSSNYLDEKGVSWESPLSWLWSGILGGCGCGKSETFARQAWKVLDLFATEHKNRNWSVYDKHKYEILANWMDSKDLIEHGTSIAGSWLTEYGYEVYKTIKVLNVK